DLRPEPRRDRDRADFTGHDQARSPSTREAALGFERLGLVARLLVVQGAQRTRFRAEEPGRVRLLEVDRTVGRRNESVQLHDVAGEQLGATASHLHRGDAFRDGTVLDDVGSDQERAGSLAQLPRVARQFAAAEEEREPEDRAGSPWGDAGQAIAIVATPAPARPPVAPQ